MVVTHVKRAIRTVGKARGVVDIRVGKRVVSRVVYSSSRKGGWAAQSLCEGLKEWTKNNEQGGPSEGT